MLFLLNQENTVDPDRLALLETSASTLFSTLNENTVKPVLSGHSKRRPKIRFQDRLLLNADQKYCRMLQGEHSAIL